MGKPARHQPLALVLGAALCFVSPALATPNPATFAPDRSDELVLLMGSCEEPDHGTTLARLLVLRLLALSDADLSRFLLPNLHIQPHYRPALRGACGKSQFLIAESYRAQLRVARRVTAMSAPLPRKSTAG